MADKIKEIKAIAFERSVEAISRRETNADRIRAMTDEALWHFLEDWGISKWCPHKKCGDMEDCRDCIYDWLKKEVEDGSSD